MFSQFSRYRTLLPCFPPQLQGSCSAHIPTLACSPSLASFLLPLSDPFLIISSFSVFRPLDFSCKFFFLSVPPGPPGTILLTPLLLQPIFICNLPNFFFTFIFTVPLMRRRRHFWPCKPLRTSFLSLIQRCVLHPLRTDVRLSWEEDPWLSTLPLVFQSFSLPGPDFNILQASP